MRGKVHSKIVGNPSEQKVLNFHQSRCHALDFNPQVCTSNSDQTIILASRLLSWDSIASKKLLRNLHCRIIQLRNDSLANIRVWQGLEGPLRTQGHKVLNLQVRDIELKAFQNLVCCSVLYFASNCGRLVLLFLNFSRCSETITCQKSSASFLFALSEWVCKSGNDVVTLK